MIYKDRESEFGQSNAFKCIKIVGNLFRDFIGVLVIILLNFLIFYQFRSIVANKKKILFKKENFKKETRSQLKIAKMVIIVGIVQSLGHIPYVTKYFLDNVCLEEIVNIFYIFSIDCYFFIYYFFNSIFNQSFNFYFYRLFFCIKNSKRALKYIDKSSIDNTQTRTWIKYRIYFFLDKLV